jgi:hypothetical protein
MQILDQQIMPPRHVTQEFADLLQCFSIELPALGKGPRPLP